MKNNINILEHIKKYGNTNLISDSGLPCGSQIFAIGDSHTIFFHNSLKIKEHWLCVHELPLTIYKLINNDLNLYEIGNILRNGHENYNIKEKDYVIFFFGYNDMQKYIYLHYRDNWKHEIDNLINNYVNKIVLYKNKFKIIPIISCIYPNPRDGAIGTDCYGSNIERLQYILYANKILKNLCENLKLNFLDTFQIISDNKGQLKNNYTIDNIHLDYNNEELRNIIENEIYKLIQ
jgi:hypothetical protein